MRRLDIAYIDKDFSITALDDPNWTRAGGVVIGKYWSDEPAPVGRHCEVRLLWSDRALYGRFVANQSEPLVVNSAPNLAAKTMGLWDRDLCEIFVAPDPGERNKYFEFEIAPTGEWIDLSIEVLPDQRVTDWDYASGMESATSIEQEIIIMAMKIPFRSLGKTPSNGDVWLGNLFRCVGSGATRGYLAWQPTKTKVPAFHVPKAFGEFQFVNKRRLV